MSVPGGLTGSKPATDEIQGIVDSVIYFIKDHLQNKL